MSCVMWTTRGGRKVPAKKLKSDHLTNCVRMLRYKTWEDMSLRAILDRGPNGDMARLAFEEYQDSVLNGDVDVEQLDEAAQKRMPVMKALLSEAKRRRLPIRREGITEQMRRDLLPFLCRALIPLLRQNKP